MSLGISSDCDAKGITEFLANKLDKIEGAGESSLCSSPLVFASRWITSEGYNVTDSSIKALLECILYTSDGITVLLHVGACKMHIGCK
jgi:hypothetical protein